MVPRLPSDGKQPPTSFPMHSGIFVIAVLSLICWAIQLLPVISVPLTGKSPHYNLSLSHYNNISFGVFGICDTVHDSCLSPRIGYPHNASIAYPTDRHSSETVATHAEVQLPSNVTYLVSKLLVLHVVAFGFTCFLLIQSVSLLVADAIRKQSRQSAQINNLWKKLRKRPRIDEDTSSICEETVSDADASRRRKHQHQLTFIVVFAILSFLSSLLAFLTDFVLFVPKLGPLGWIQMLPVLIMAIIASLSCFLKRSIQSRRHREESAFLADEMRTKHTVFVEWDDDLQSEDGVFIYSNGFCTEHKEDEQRVTSLPENNLSIPRVSLNTDLQSLQSLDHSRDGTPP